MIFYSIINSNLFFGVKDSSCLKIFDCRDSTFLDFINNPECNNHFFNEIADAYVLSFVTA